MKIRPPVIELLRGDRRAPFETIKQRKKRANVPELLRYEYISHLVRTIRNTRTISAYVYSCAFSAEINYLCV
jgi:hypothetical protein